MVRGASYWRSIMKHVPARLARTSDDRGVIAAQTLMQ